jgi:hypothetical protein
MFERMQSEGSLTPACTGSHPNGLQEADAIIVEAAEPGQGLQYYRVPAPQDPLAESDSEDAAAAATGSKSAKAGSSSSSKPQQQQQQQPIRVHIPSVNRHVNSFGAGNGIGSAPAAAAAAQKSKLPPTGLNANSSISSSLKYDPLSQRGSKKGSSSSKPPRSNSSSSSAPAGTSPSSPVPAPEDGDLYDDMPALDMDTEGQQQQQRGEEGSAPVRENSSGSVSALMSGMDETVAARLDKGNLPSFLRTPVRRDGDDNLPTQSN